MPKRKRNAADELCLGGESNKPLKRARSGFVNLKHIPQAVQARYGNATAQHNSLVDHSFIPLRLTAGVC